MSHKFQGLSYDCLGSKLMGGKGGPWAWWVQGNGARWVMILCANGGDGEYYQIMMRLMLLSEKRTLGNPLNHHESWCIICKLLPLASVFL